RGHAIDRAAADLDVARFATQPGAAAVGAREVAAIAAQEHAHVDFVFLALEPAEEPADPFVVVISAGGGTLDDEADFVFRQLGPRHVEPELRFASGALQLGELRAIVRLAPRLDGA